MPSTEDAFCQHNHHHCIEAAINQAVTICAERKGRLTKQRKRVLELIWKSHQPVGAYSLLEQLRNEGFNGAPPTVYRALDFLLEHGLIHRLESLNAYAGCCHPNHEHNGQFLICQRCHQVAEITDSSVSQAIKQSAAKHGFAATDPVIEIPGLCQQCQQESIDEHS